MSNKLTQKQENFAQCIFSGMSQYDSYIKVYNSTAKRRTIDHNASVIRHSSKIATRIDELRAEVKTENVADVQERLEILTEIARAKIPDYQSPDGILVNQDSPNTSAIESIEVITKQPRDSHAGGITVKRPVVPEALRNTIFKRDNHKCRECEATENLQIDHIISLSRGGMTIFENLQTLCETCNKRKAGGKKSQPEVITKLKLHNPIAAIAELNKMDHIYDDRPTSEPVVYNSFVFVLPDGTRVGPKQLREVNSGQERADQAESTALQSVTE